ncbi:MAG TPA: terminase, partial [Lachnospiraceae bacterium]|nr:terminase [Lachnospiraceae bacterium]
DLWQTDDRVIYQSNPVTINNKRIFETLIGKRALAILYENKRENYLCKHNNILYKGLGVEGYVDIQRVKLCSIPDDPGWWNGRRVWIGLDLSQSDDNTSFSMVTEEDGIVYSKTFGFIPVEKKDLKSKKEHVDYDRLIKQGTCYECGSDVIDYLFVKDKIEALQEEYGVEIQQIGYDRWNALATVQALEADGFECVEIKQHSSVLHMPTKWLRELILEKSFRYSANRMLEINFQNARCTEDTNLNKYVNKKKSSGKVDMVVSLINAMYLLQQETLYGDGGFVVQVV